MPWVCMRAGADIASKRSLFSTIQLLFSRLLRWCRAATSARPALLADPLAVSSSSASAMSLSAARNSGSCMSSCLLSSVSSYPGTSSHSWGVEQPMLYLAASDGHAT